MKAQQPLLGVKRGGEEAGEEGEEEEEQKHLFVGKSYELSRTVFTSEIGQ